jgi:hypothetical protein
MALFLNMPGRSYSPAHFSDRDTQEAKDVCMSIESLNAESTSFTNIAEVWKSHAPKATRSDGDTAHLSPAVLNATNAPVSGIPALASSSAAEVLHAHSGLDADRALALLARLGS